ncbi:MAG: aminoacyl-tRNA hydrolase [Clostridium sp.]|jgi:PTH1 family peptidyl-tRNA hydrolase|nr:aminoacyl-tRNA hydrolase [Clostridium sp.]
MFAIVGLGNPGKNYMNTRHNVGFDLIDAIAKQEKCSLLNCKHHAVTGSVLWDGQKVLLVKPQTFMNLSGQSVREVVEYYQIDAGTKLLVISDDVNLPVGHIRIRTQGSAGGHNGLKNIITMLGHQDFMRLRIGVGGNEQSDLADYVTGHFTKGERSIIDESIGKAIEATHLIADGQIELAMNRYNQ